jgi:hypothetical protein
MSSSHAPGSNARLAARLVARLGARVGTRLAALGARVATLAATLLLVAPAAADPVHVDVETDPTAYVLSGSSVHVGIGKGRFRLDLGNFALAMPQFVHGDDGFDVSFHGFGAKLQVFPFEAQRGLFAGVDAGVARMLIERQGTDLAVRQDQLGVGIHVGYRIPLFDRFYATPWIGVGYQFHAKDMMLADATYEPQKISVFPAVHLGYRFQ